MSLHAGVYAGFAHPAIPDRYDRPAVSPPLAARRRADRRTQRIPPNGPVLLKDGPNTASRRRPLERPQRESVRWDLSRMTWTASRFGHRLTPWR